MKIRTTLEEAVEMIRQKAEFYWDETFPANAIHFYDFENVKVDDQTYSMMESAKRLVAHRLRIPFEYLKRCPNHLQETNLNHWVRTLENMRLFLRFDDQKLRAMFTTRYRVINNHDILKRLLQCNISENKDVFLTLSNEIMVLNMPDHQRTFGLFKDQITPGMSLVNSEVGLAAFSVQAFFLRLVCTNGLITAEMAQNKIRHIRKNALVDLEGLISNVNFMAEQNQKKMRLAVYLRINEPLTTIENFNRRFNLSKREGEIVKESWQKEPVYNMWGIINSYTQAAQESEVSADRAYRLQQIGGLVLNLVKS